MTAQTAQTAQTETQRFVAEVSVRRPDDVFDERWRNVLEGLERFIADGWLDKARNYGWTDKELLNIPERWARVDLTGVGLLLAGRTVFEAMSKTIKVRTASGAVQSFYRWPKGRV